jgi:hypothetical protein
LKHAASSRNPSGNILSQPRRGGAEGRSKKKRRLFMLAFQLRAWLSAVKIGLWRIPKDVILYFLLLAEEG